MVFGFIKNLLRKDKIYLEVYKEGNKVKIREIKEDKYKNYLEVSA